MLLDEGERSLRILKIVWENKADIGIGFNPLRPSGNYMNHLL
jgi:hypothetical protein